MVRFYNHPNQDINWVLSLNGATYTTWPGTDILSTITANEGVRIGEYNTWYFDNEGYLIKKEHYNQGGLGEVLTYSHEGVLTDTTYNTAAPHEGVPTYNQPTLDYGYSYVGGEKVSAPDYERSPLFDVPSVDQDIPMSNAFAEKYQQALIELGGNRITAPISQTPPKLSSNALLLLAGAALLLMK